MGKLLVIACLFTAFVQVYNKPVFVKGVTECFGQRCPKNTFACEKFSKLTNDKKQIVNDIRCLGTEKGEVVLNMTTFEDNPWGEGASYQGYSYTGAYTMGGFSSVDVDANGFSSEKKDQPTGHGEVDDLNNF